MAIGKKSGGRDFVKGRSGNPDGRPPLPPEVKAARKINQHEYELICNRLFFLTEKELKKICKSKTAPVLEKMVAKQMWVALLTGDYKRIDSVLNRNVGKPGTSVEVGLTDEEREARKKEAQGGENAPLSWAELALKAKLAKEKKGTT